MTTTTSMAIGAQQSLGADSFLTRFVSTAGRPSMGRIVLPTGLRELNALAATDG